MRINSINIAQCELLTFGHPDGELDLRKLSTQLRAHVVALDPEATAFLEAAIALVQCPDPISYVDIIQPARNLLKRPGYPYVFHQGRVIT